MTQKEAAQRLFGDWADGLTEGADEDAADIHSEGDVGNTNDIIEAWLKSLGAI